MRLFTGIELPAGVLAALEKLLARLRPEAALRWSRVENLHITTKFIGEWAEDRLGEVEAALRAMPARARIPIEVRGLGWFPNPHQPRVFWTGVRAPAALAELARDTDAALRPLGVPAEDRAYAPHLTLARIDRGRGRATVDLAALRRAVASLEEPAFGQFDCTEFHLYLSEMRPGGSRYTKLHTYPLEAS